MSDGVDGVLYDVFLAGEKVGETCVTEQQAEQQEQVTPGRVLRAFQSLSWPQSELAIQPPGGQTLVNFATNFYTDNVAPTQQSVTLLGRSVLIEATPTTYTWRYGDGTSAATASPGAPYPALDVTHGYATLGTFAPSVDTTYTGRYRLDGGPWTAIPESLDGRRWGGAPGDDRGATDSRRLLTGQAAALHRRGLTSMRATWTVGRTTARLLRAVTSAAHAAAPQE